MGAIAQESGHPLLQKTVRAVGVVLVLAVVGLLSRPLEAPAWKVVRAGQPEFNLSKLESALGQGLIVGVLGGFRSITADFLWIRLNTVWEQKERAKLDALVKLATQIDPRPLFFWINGARMIAYDVPNWRIVEEGGYDAVPESRQRAIDREQAEQAFAFLRQAMEFHPRDPGLYLEFAQIYLNRLKDDAAAAEWFLKASELPGAPYYAARIHAELLRRLDRPREAYDFLTALYRELPKDDPYAQTGVVLERIRQLEAELAIPAGDRFRP